MSAFAYVWNEYRQFLQRPNPEISFRPDEVSPAGRFWISLLLAFILVIPIMLIFGILEHQGLFPASEEHAVRKLMETYPLPLVFGGAALLGPLLEEFAFRLALVPKKNYLIISLWLATSYYLGVLFQNELQEWAYGLLLLLAVLTALMIGLPRQWNYRFQLLYSLNYNWVFYGFTLLFAAAHLFNFNLSLRVLVLSPLLVLPQLVLGTLLGYLRMRQGMAWAIALHITYNSILLALAYQGAAAEF